MILWLFWAKMSNLIKYLGTYFLPNGKLIGWFSGVDRSRRPVFVWSQKYFNLENLNLF